jgi:cytoskeletal protein RodZ
MKGSTIAAITVVIIIVIFAALYMSGMIFAAPAPAPVVLTPIAAPPVAKPTTTTTKTPTTTTTTKTPTTTTTTKTPTTTTTTTTKPPATTLAAGCWKAPERPHVYRVKADGSICHVPDPTAYATMCPQGHKMTETSRFPSPVDAILKCIA